MNYHQAREGLKQLKGNLLKLSRSFSSKEKKGIALKFPPHNSSNIELTIRKPPPSITSRWNSDAFIPSRAKLTTTGHNINKTKKHILTHFPSIARFALRCRNLRGSKRAIKKHVERHRRDSLTEKGKQQQGEMTIERYFVILLC